jgi:hypothetical protein
VWVQVINSTVLSSFLPSVPCGCCCLMLMLTPIPSSLPSSSPKPPSVYLYEILTTPICSAKFFDLVLQLLDIGLKLFNG